MKLIKYSLSFLIIFSFCFCLFGAVQAVGLGDAFNKAGTVAQGAGYGQNDLFSSVGNIITAVLSLLGVIFLGLLIYGGYVWMTARGNEQQVKKAQNTITTAIVGLVIVLAAYAISYFVISELSNSGVLKS